MQEIRLKIADGKFQFFMELIKSFDFVQVEEGDSKESIMTNIKQGLKDAKLAKEGKLKTTSLDDFLNEL